MVNPRHSKNLWAWHKARHRQQGVRDRILRLGCQRQRVVAGRALVEAVFPELIESAAAVDPAQNGKRNSCAPWLNVTGWSFGGFWILPSESMPGKWQSWWVLNLGMRLKYPALGAWRWGVNCGKCGGLLALVLTRSGIDWAHVDQAQGRWIVPPAFLYGRCDPGRLRAWRGPSRGAGSGRRRCLWGRK